MSLLGAARVRELLERQGVRPTKALGQNFVIDPNTIRKMVKLSRIGAADRVLEIGAGAGSLTLGLAETGAHVLAIEFDRRLMPALEEATRGVAGVEIMEADALRFDLSSVDANHLAGNLPYNIAATVVLRALDEAPQLQSLTVMTQREVGERLAAGPGDKAYGLPSVLVAYHGAARVVGRVSRNAFFPVPGVDSVIVRIERTTPPDIDHAELRAVVRAAFGQRRKMVRRALAAAREPGEIEAALQRAAIPSEARAEELSLDQFVTLTRELQAGPL
jgi:16S rRNA (adenine1518-N6/adenine1519-N6)-dimethyltransferase